MHFAGGSKQWIATGEQEAGRSGGPAHNPWSGRANRCAGATRICNCGLPCKGPVARETMARASLKEASELQRKARVPDHARTSHRDAVAECIATYLEDHDWGATTLTELAEHCGCSRQHVSDVLNAYFEPPREHRAEDLESLAEMLDDDRGTDAQTAYRDGAIDMLSFLLQNPEVLAPLLNRRE